MNLLSTWCDVTISKGLEDILEVHVIEKIYFNRMTKVTKNRLRKAIVNGVAPVAYNNSGKLSCAYSLLCRHVGLPVAFLSTQSRGLFVEDIVSEPMLEELNAMHLLVMDKELNNYAYYNRNLTKSYKQGRFSTYVSTWSTNITPEALGSLISRHRPLNEERVKRALHIIDEGLVVETDREVQ